VNMSSQLYTPSYAPEILTQTDIEAAAYVERKINAKLAGFAAEIKRLQEIVEAYRWVTPGLLIDSRIAERIVIEAQIEAAWREHEAAKQP